MHPFKELAIKTKNNVDELFGKCKDNEHSIKVRDQRFRELEELIVE